MFERYRGIICVVAVSLAFTGCGRPQPASSPALETSEQEGRPARDRPARAPNSDPGVAMNRLVADLAAGRGDGVFAALPPKYRQDVDHYLVSRIRPADTKAWRQASEAVARFAESLAAKERFVLASERFEIAGPAAEVVRERFGAICRLVAATARWPGWNEPNGDAKALTSAIAAAVVQNEELAAELRSLRFETASKSKDRATLKVAGRDRELAVVCIDDVWVPATVADGWDALFGDGSGSGEELKSDDLTSLAGRLDEVTAALSKVATQEEFDALADRAATLLLATAAQIDHAPRAVRPEEFVTVEVLGEMTETQKDQIVWRLTTLTDDPRSGLADASDRADGEGLIVNVGPVTDLAAFAKRLEGLKVENVDANKKTVTARFVGP